MKKALKSSSKRLFFASEAGTLLPNFLGSIESRKTIWFKLRNCVVTVK